MNTISKFSLIVGLSLLVLLPTISMAAGGSDNTNNAPITVSSVPDLIGKVNKFVRLAVSVLFVLATIFIIIAAFKYLTGKGDPNEIKKAQGMIVWAIVAMVVALFAWAIPKLVVTFLGASSVGTLNDTSSGFDF